MRRFWVGIILLGALLCGGLVSTAVMDRIHKPISRELKEAAEAALSGNISEGAVLAMEAKASWEKHWQAIAAAADHEPMDEINGLFAMLEIYAREEEKTDFAACCAQLARLIQAMSGAHSLTWWNLL